MKIFISWSGDRSKELATALKLWLSDVFPEDVQTWMSNHDIGAGARWNVDLANELDSANFGILCLTPENLEAPWLLFEAGSLAKIVNAARVVPYRLNLTATDVGYPLAQFQGVDADKQGTYKLVESINDLRDDKFSETKLTRIFNKWWPDLEAQLVRIVALPALTQIQRPDRALLEELLQLVRTIVREEGSSGKVTPTYQNNERDIYGIDEANIAAMSNVELRSYLSEVCFRYDEGRISDNERDLIKRMRMAEAELERRQRIGKTL